MSIWETLVGFYESSIFIYCTALFTCYVFLAITSIIAINRNLFRGKFNKENGITKLSLAPGISIVAPAFNESNTIIYNVRSLMTLDYPKYEVIIVNDGSTDDTLEKLIEEFNLVEVEYAYQEIAISKPVKRFFKSTDIAYKKLLVVDKVNGKSKADAVNAGLNAAAFSYFLNTDVDCILSNDTLIKLIQPFLTESKKVIAVGAGLRMVNSCDIDAGMMIRVRAPMRILPRFQEMEYIRSFSLGKMGWSLINGVPNVSGGLGLFDKEIALKVGGYDSRSLGEDMDMVVRMSRYMCETDQEYVIRYIPQTLCWTEGPETLKIFVRQRVRWARGLIQIYKSNIKLLFNPKYKQLGMVIYPYNFIFELLAPIIEIIGICIFVISIITKTVGWPYAVVMLLFVYSFFIFLSTLAILWDQLIFRNYKSWREVSSLALMALIEPVIYHPIILFSSLKGYIEQLTGKVHKWGQMQRKGFKQVTSAKVNNNV